MEIIICNKSKAIKQKESCKGSYQDLLEESRRIREESRRVMFKHRKIIAEALKDYPEEYEKFLQEISMYKEMIKCNPLPKASNFDLKELNKHLVGK